MREQKEKIKIIVNMLYKKNPIIIMGIYESNNKWIRSYLGQWPRERNEIVTKKLNF